VPIWVCGNTRAAIRRAARIGDAWNPFGIGLADFTAGIATLRALAGERAPTVAAHMQVRIGVADRRAHISGSADDVSSVLAQYQRAGLTYLICDFIADDLDELLQQMRIMAEQIVPVLA
jgi:alkanesulfonate monooxygenase SsuD/methylene tetrahydromethanopterin reductase-like flavin-dependent oxidoreductase (luciferase family)